MERVLRAIAKVGVGGLLLIAGCGRLATPPARQVSIHQNWALQPGSEVAGYHVSGGLGDISIELKGKAARAPFNGKVQPSTAECVMFSSPEVPAYLFRFCGLHNIQLGEIEAGHKIGSGETLQFAALRKQPDGTWALVEPAVDILERTVSTP
ncbi:MAG: hypothetical protein HC886_01925 [Leptolyngbyaceae cyanobacterium SM1_1_3]|nr:hypothetical protein [Leptolyngbyaceae cyanobacterium SM1_1_3]NJN03112.1 hypothetical protein [Leptolyngbyaceae cyanobacterium RM1_1_2]NJO09610.1 hypothetical protein [Leptolyngbyaceae cyanobacterium SL_1_1]